MNQPYSFRAEDGLSFSCYGARISIFSNHPAALKTLRLMLPPHAIPMATPGYDFFYRLHVRDGDGGRSLCSVSLRTDPWLDGIPLKEALDQIASALHFTVSCYARDMLFVHAGAVGWKGRALLLPGASHSGKTSLVRALVEAGATYYSDEFAVLDDEGQLHPYARPLAVRDTQGRVTLHSVASFGGTAGTTPLPVALVLAARYEASATWQPKVLTSGQAVLRLLKNTVLARKMPERAVAVFEHVMQTAHALEGKRGEAARIAPLLLQKLETSYE